MSGRVLWSEGVELRTHIKRNGRYLESIAYGTNGYRLEAYATLRRRVSRRVPGETGFQHDLETSLKAQEGNVA